jgi:hypothetical protein
MESYFAQARPDWPVVAAAIRAKINACQAETPTWITLRAKIAQAPNAKSYLYDFAEQRIWTIKKDC